MTLLTPELLDTKTYGFEKLRYLLQSLGIQEGVIDTNDLRVIQRALGANMSVDVGAGRCFVQADSGTRNGLYHEVNDAPINVAVPASNATNPRVDQVVLEIHDSSDLGSADDTPQLYVVAGAPTAGATLDNRTGAAALPNNAILLADILVPAASSSVITANIRDRRKWARGAYQRQVMATADFSTTSTTFGAGAPSMTTALRMECSGAPLRVSIRAGLRHSVASAVVLMGPRVDGAMIDGITQNAFWQRFLPSVISTSLKIVDIHDTIPTPGSHLLDVALATVTAGTVTANELANNPAVVTVEEVVRQVADNT